MSTARRNLNHDALAKTFIHKAEMHFYIYANVMFASAAGSRSQLYFNFWD